jgi:hypothetical protein
MEEVISGMTDDKVKSEIAIVRRRLDAMAEMEETLFPIGPAGREYRAMCEYEAALKRRLRYRMIMAAEEGNTDLVIELLDSGADVHGWSDEAIRNAGEN